MINKPYAESCDRNAAQILAVIRQKFSGAGEILEIGSGTGQHAVYFAEAMPSIRWQTSDQNEMHAGIQMWLDDAGANNILPPLSLDVVVEQDWPVRKFDGVFSANTAHIMAKDAVAKMFTGVARVLKPEGLFLLYGPYMYQGKHTSESNELFDRRLRLRQPQSGVRDLEWLREIAAKVGLILLEDVEMPANNRILIWGLARDSQQESD